MEFSFGKTKNTHIFIYVYGMRWIDLQYVIRRMNKIQHDNNIQIYKN